VTTVFDDNQSGIRDCLGQALALPDGDQVSKGLSRTFAPSPLHQAYNPDLEFIHSKNVLDGDEYCEFMICPAFPCENRESLL